MKNIILLSSIIATLLLSSCDLFKSDTEKFADTYRKVLINTALNENDSLKLMNELQRILEEDGYTMESFKDEFVKIANENPDEFMHILDTMRESVANEVVNITNGKPKQ